MVSAPLPSSQKSNPACTVTSSGADRSSTSCRRGPAADPLRRDRAAALGVQRAQQGVGDVAARVAAARRRLQAEEDRAVDADQRGPGERQDRRQGDRAVAEPRGVLRSQRQRRGRRRHDLAHRDPVRLSRAAPNGRRTRPCPALAAARPWQALYRRPLPHGHGSRIPTTGTSAPGSTGAAGAGRGDFCFWATVGERTRRASGSARRPSVTPATVPDRRASARHPAVRRDSVRDARAGRRGVTQRYAGTACATRERVGAARPSGTPESVRDARAVRAA